MPRHLTSQAQQLNPPATAETASSSLRLFACERCHRRKQKCDRLIPQCTPCKDSASACVVSNREEAVVQGRTGEGSRKGYVSTLLDRIAECEAEAEALGISTSQAQGQGQTQETQDPAYPPTELNLPGPSPGPPRARANRDCGFNLSSLSLSVMAEPRNRGGEFLRQLSISRIVAGVTETYGGNPEAISRVNSLWDGISKYIRQPIGTTHRLYIPPDEAAKALRTYLEVVDFRFPRLPVAKVQAGMDAISAADDDALYRETLRRDPAHIFMAYAVTAIVPLVSDRYPISQGSWVSLHLLSKCLKVLDRVFNDEDGVDVIHCLHLLVILSMHCSAAGSAWHLVGFAMNKCIALGYHREDDRAAVTVSPAEIQQRRWAFWGCYLLDRLISAALDRPFSINDRDVTVPLPEAAETPTATRTRGDADADADADAQSSGDIRQEGDRFVQESRTRTGTRTRAKVLGHTAGRGVTGEHGPSPPSREALDTHLFRYAMVFHSVVVPTAAGHINFDDHLGQALLWRSQTPEHHGEAATEIYQYQTSLYNTLMLRIVIKETLSAFEYVSADGSSSEGSARLVYKNIDADHGGEPRPSPISDGSRAAAAWERYGSLEPARLRELKVVDVCRGAARSLDRRCMVSRNYLSMLTGYSALSLALTCIYCMVVQAVEETGHAGSQADNMVWNPPQRDGLSLPYSNVGTFSPTASAARPCPCGSVYVDTSQATGYAPNDEITDSRVSIYRSLSSLLHVAFAKLDIAGRQFPRLLEYKSGLERLNSLVNRWRMRRVMESPWQHSRGQASLRNEIDAVGVDDIGPGHLNKLADVILHVVGLP